MLPDKSLLNHTFFDRSENLNGTKQTELFSDNNINFESSLSKMKSNPSDFTKMLPCHSNVDPQVNQLFKIPNVDNLPAKKANVKSIRSPRLKVQNGKVKNNMKPGQNSKTTLIPCPSFINSRKSLHGSRSSQLNARKELIKKMVFLTECSLKENREVKQSTPVKMLAGVTPKKTPRSGNYFILPEFTQKLPKLEDIRSPIKDLVKKEMFAYSSKPTATFVKKNEISPHKQHKVNESSSNIKPENEVKSEMNFSSILSHCEIFSAEVSMIYEKIKHLDETFENKLNQIPDYRVYNEFCIYQIKKEDLYKELQALEIDLRHFVSAETKIGNNLRAYVKKKQELLEKQLNLHKEFERAVKSMLQKCDQKECGVKVIREIKPKVETPKLRRSMRLSKIKKSKFEEKSPITRKLKKLDSKSKGIQRSEKIRSP